MLQKNKIRKILIIGEKFLRIRGTLEGKGSGRNVRGEQSTRPGWFNSKPGRRLTLPFCDLSASAFGVGIARSPVLAPRRLLPIQGAIIGQKGGCDRDQDHLFEPLEILKHHDCLRGTTYFQTFSHRGMPPGGMEEVFDELAGAFLYQLSEAGPAMTLPFLWPIGIAR
jgi:hypothetical protein